MPLVLPRSPLGLGRLPTPIGTVLVLTAGDVVCALEFEDCAERLGRTLRRNYPDQTTRPLGTTPHARALTAWFDGDPIALDGIPLAPAGTPFQQRVWAALHRVPHGTTSHYGDLARAIGHPGAARAVGAANGANPISVLIPCHRLVGAGGALIRYGGGLHRKAWLLDHERRHAG